MIEIRRYRELYWPTSDQWYPNFENNTVRVTLLAHVSGERPFARLCVWGADDCGMELDKFCRAEEIDNTVAELSKLLESLPNPISKYWLRENGFVPA